MYTRSAIFQGRILEGQEDKFYAGVERDLLPIWKRMPGALAVRAYRPIDCDEHAPPVFLVQEVDYASLDDIATALASPVRLEGREATLELMTLAEGSFSHLVFRRIEPA